MKEKSLLMIKTKDIEELASAHDVEFIVGRQRLGGVISVEIDKIESNTLVKATVELYVKLGGWLI